jgi:hypothetical protein
MNLEPMQDRYSRIIRAVFGAVFGLLAGLVFWLFYRDEGLAESLLVGAGLVLTSAYAAAEYGDRFWRGLTDADQ